EGRRRGAESQGEGAEGSDLAHGLPSHPKVKDRTSMRRAGARVNGPADIFRNSPTRLAALPPDGRSGGASKRAVPRMPAIFLERESGLPVTRKRNRVAPAGSRRGVDKPRRRTTSRRGTCRQGGAMHPYRCALVTGGTRGIGAAFARCLPL